MGLIHFKKHRSRLNEELLLAQADRDFEDCKRIIGEIGRLTSIIRAYEEQMAGMTPDEVQVDFASLELGL